jgi:hypothetical protein
MPQDPNVPPGWTYNPSARSHRNPIVVAALAGFLIAGYMAAFQFRWIDAVWDPFFGDDTEEVLTSDISHALPVPDAALGALAYLADVIAGSIGGRRRWKTSPWAVLAFGFFVGPLGVVSVLLVILQPTYVGAWCTLCMVTAVIGPALDEVLATAQHLRRVHDRGGSVWRALLGKDRDDDDDEPAESPPPTPDGRRAEEASR